MRPKRKNVCQNCRAKKLACDGAQPECSQCVFKQIRCSGYKQEFVFVGNTTVNTNVRTESAQKKKTTFARSTVVLDTHTIHAKKTQRSASPSDTTGPVLPVEASIVESQSCYDLEDDIQFIMEQFAPADEHTSGEPSLSYNQICGAWINVLPLIAKNRSKDYPLVPAIRALASALRRHSDVDVDGQGCRPRIVEVYCESLRHMGRAIAEARGASSIEHITAIMCLADTDIIAPELKSGWMTHVRAVGDMLERLGPTAFSIGTMHTMFIGFRPLLLLSSILHRHGTFLAREEWITEPFQGQPVSIIQQLLNRACSLPALLERFCEINHISSLPDLVTVNQLEQDFHAVLSRLREWEQTFKSQVSHPLFWSRSDPETWSLPGANALWFPNMMTATSLTHYWAFEIVLRTHISALHQIASTAKGHNSQTHTNVYTEASAEYSLLVLADMICDSTSYLLQPVFKYHGLWSAFFTLPTALRVFRQEQVLSSSRARRSQRIAKLLASRDVYFPENYLV